VGDSGDVLRGTRRTFNVLKGTLKTSRPDDDSPSARKRRNRACDALLTAQKMNPRSPQKATFATMLPRTPNKNDITGGILPGLGRREQASSRAWHSVVSGQAGWGIASGRRGDQSSSASTSSTACATGAGSVAGARWWVFRRRTGQPIDSAAVASFSYGADSWT